MKTEVVMNGHLTAKFVDLIICAHLRDLIVRNHADVRVSVVYETCGDCSVFMHIVVLITGERDDALLEVYAEHEPLIKETLKKAVAELRARGLMTEFDGCKCAMATT